MTKISRLSSLKSNRAVKKLSVKRMRWNVCDNSSSSSGEEDIVPIIPEDLATLPESSSDELSTIEESHLENDTSSNSTTSEYMSSLMDEDLLSVSEDERRANGKPMRRDRLDCQSPTRTSNASVASTDVAIDVPSYPHESESMQERQTQVDLNEHHNRRNLAQALMNLALLAANANQLMHLLENFEDKPLFYVAFSCIITSMVVQFLVKILLMINCRYNLNVRAEARRARRMNNAITVAILIIAVANFTITGVIMFNR